MKIASWAFEHNSKIPQKYTCDGENINPPLEFLQTPVNAKSLALVVDDPDAPSKTWVHWVVFNIDPKTNLISENSKPEGAVEGTTSFGKPGYGGPCPPPASPALPWRGRPENLQRGESGTHRYFFKLYALDSLLNLPIGSERARIEIAMLGHIIDRAELVGLYSKKH